MFKIKKDDIVEAIKGKDKGKKGKVLQVFPAVRAVLVEGINQVKKHKRQTKQEEAGGIISIEKPMSLSKVMLFCKNCNKGARFGVVLLKDKTKARVCKRCKTQM